MDAVTMALAQSYTDEALKGMGALKGKNCTIESITELEKEMEVVFQWTLDDGTVKKESMKVPKGSGSGAEAFIFTFDFEPNGSENPISNLSATYDEIKAAIDGGMTVYGVSTISGYMYMQFTPDVWMDGMLLFSAANPDGGLPYLLMIDSSGSGVVQMGELESDVFSVPVYTGVLEDGTRFIDFDCSYDEINNAFGRTKAVVCKLNVTEQDGTRYDVSLYTQSRANGTIVFSGKAAPQGVENEYTLTIKYTGEKTLIVEETDEKLRKAVKTANDYTDEQIEKMSIAEALSVDEKPLYNEDGTITYIQDGVAQTLEKGYVWFYYRDADGVLLQTIWIDGTEHTLKDGDVDLTEYLKKTSVVMLKESESDPDPEYTPTDIPSMGVFDQSKTENDIKYVHKSSIVLPKESESDPELVYSPTDIPSMALTDEYRSAILEEVRKKKAIFVDEKPVYQDGTITYMKDEVEETTTDTTLRFYYLNEEGMMTQTLWIDGVESTIGESKPVESTEYVAGDNITISPKTIEEESESGEIITREAFEISSDAIIESPLELPDNAKPNKLYHTYTNYDTSEFAAIISGEFRRYSGFTAVQTLPTTNIIETKVYLIPGTSWNIYSPTEDKWYTYVYSSEIGVLDFSEIEPVDNRLYRLLQRVYKNKMYKLVDGAWLGYEPEFFPAGTLKMVDDVTVHDPDLDIDKTSRQLKGFSVERRRDSMPTGSTDDPIEKDILYVDVTNGSTDEEAALLKRYEPNLSKADDGYLRYMPVDSFIKPIDTMSLLRDLTITPPAPQSFVIADSLLYLQGYFKSSQTFSSAGWHPVCEFDLATIGYEWAGLEEGMPIRTLISVWLDGAYVNSAISVYNVTGSQSSGRLTIYITSGLVNKAIAFNLNVMLPVRKKRT